MVLHLLYPCIARVAKSNDVDFAYMDADGRRSAQGKLDQMNLRALAPRSQQAQNLAAGAGFEPQVPRAVFLVSRLLPMVPENKGIPKLRSIAAHDRSTTMVPMGNKCWSQQEWRFATAWPNLAMQVRG